VTFDVWRGCPSHDVVTCMCASPLPCVACAGCAERASLLYVSTQRDTNCSILANFLLHATEPDR
jgi:hypothetical protein